MAIAVMTELHGLTQENYDVLQHQLAQAGVADGVVLHVAGPMEDGWWTFDVWESQAAADAFYNAEPYTRALQQLGQSTSRTWPVHAMNKQDARSDDAREHASGCSLGA